MIDGGCEQESILSFFNLAAFETNLYASKERTQSLKSLGRRNNNFQNVMLDIKIVHLTTSTSFADLPSKILP